MEIHNATIGTELPQPFVEGFDRRMASLNDKPYLDVHVCDHCNLRCAGCLHFSPLAPEVFLDLREYERDLARLSRLEGADGYFRSICLMGGEPLMHPRVADVVRLTRAYFPTTELVLSTNGVLWRRIDEALWQALRDCGAALLVSVYPIGVDYEAFFALAKEKGVRARPSSDRTHTEGGKERFLRLALDASGEQDLTSAFVGCPFGGVNLQLARGALWPCQVAAHAGVLADRFGVGLRSSDADALLLDGLGSLDEIERFRREPHPMCRFCKSGDITTVPWRRSTFDASEWLG